MHCRALLPIAEKRGTNVLAASSVIDLSDENWFERWSVLSVHGGHLACN
jgi:hypothetical protein